MDLIERIGSYVGMASFLGLAILALLYFSQARDVRRLRDWAGRAPERAVELERTPVQEPARHVPPALPASQHSLPATPFSETAVRKRRPLRERIRNIHIPQARYLALTVAGVLVLGGAAYGAVELIGGQDDGSSTSAPKDNGQAKTPDRAKRQVKNVDPAQVTVAILNGTTVQGLAAKIGEQVGAGGFTLGTIGNAARIDQSKSQVLYRKGESASARAVANRLGIQSISPVDSVNAEIAGSFDAIVLVGSDRSQ
jgi:hypothetical protein